MFTEEDVISSYSRAQAIEDGVLADITPLAKEAGIHFPVAITSAVLDRYVEPSPQAQKYGQDATGRLWDILTMFKLAARKTAGSYLTFKVLFQDGPSNRYYGEFVGQCGPGDNAEPVITIMLPGED